jgi:hypothetical protein
MRKSRLQTGEIVSIRLEAMDYPVGTNTISEKSGVDPDVGSGVDYGTACGNQTSQYRPFAAVGVTLKCAVKGPVKWEGKFVELITNSPR